MGIFKELTQALKNDPWIPFSKKGSKPSAKAAAPPKPESQGKSFCGPGSAQPCITVCAPREGCTCECDAIREGLLAEIRQQGLQVVVGKAKMGCSGTCANGPFIGFPQRGFFYLRVQTQDIPDIVHETLEKGNILFPLLSTNPDHSYRSDVYFERDTGFLGVMDEKTSMVEVAKYFLDFEEGLSCGKCTPCRVGIKRLNESMERIVSRQGTTEDLRTVKMLCETLRDAPHCDFAAASSKPVLSAVTFFEKEFLAVVKEVPPEPVKESGGEKKNRKLDDEQTKTAERAKSVGHEKIETLQVGEAVAPQAAPEAPVEAVVVAAVVLEPAAPAPAPEPAPEVEAVEKTVSEVLPEEVASASAAETATTSGSEEVSLAEAENAAEAEAAADLVEEAAAAPELVEAVEAHEVPEPVEVEPEAKAEAPMAATEPADEEEMPAGEVTAEPDQEMTALVEEAAVEPEAALAEELVTEEVSPESPAPGEMQAEPMVDAEALFLTEESSAEVQEAVEEPAAGTTVEDGSPVAPAELIETAGTEETGTVEAEAAAPETVTEPVEAVEAEGSGRDAGLEVEVAPSFAPPQESELETVAETSEVAPAEAGEGIVEQQEAKTKKTGASKAKGAKGKSDKEKTSGKKKKKGSSGGKK